MKNQAKESALRSRMSTKCSRKDNPASRLLHFRSGRPRSPLAASSRSSKRAWTRRGGTAMKHEEGMPLQLFVGVLLIVGGLWHAAAPWIFGYEANRAAMISNIIAGVALALVGVGIIWLRGA